MFALGADAFMGGGVTDAIASGMSAGPAVSGTGGQQTRSDAGGAFNVGQGAGATHNNAQGNTMLPIVAIGAVALVGVALIIRK